MTTRHEKSFYKSFAYFVCYQPLYVIIKSPVEYVFDMVKNYTNVTHK